MRKSGNQKLHPDKVLYFVKYCALVSKRFSTPDCQFTCCHHICPNSADEPKGDDLRKLQIRQERCTQLVEYPLHASPGNYSSIGYLLPSYICPRYALVVNVY
uniref:Uncharacterized protein n=1 Tax=Glossina austeni TaxID=7395 RepID=A0A1A9USJ1_GLOAU